MTTFPLQPLDLVPYGGQNVIYANLPNSAGLANATVEILTRTPGPVDVAVKGAEALYADACANASTTPDAWKVICWQLFGHISGMTWQTYGQNTRAADCMLELRRQLGDPSVTANAASRPAVLSEFDLDPPSPVAVNIGPAPVANATA